MNNTRTHVEILEHSNTTQIQFEWALVDRHLLTQLVTLYEKRQNAGMAEYVRSEPEWTTLLQLLKDVKPVVEVPEPTIYRSDYAATIAKLAKKAKVVRLNRILVMSREAPPNIAFWLYFTEHESFQAASMADAVMVADSYC